ncbi:thiamine pyrophosphate-dependent dehydrogenase E1 component subunit alpha [Sphingobium fuliginis]|jgi:pyruvate dehydrogenase E1 component alpha subunit|nr:thiamine pyrophosphate-dependent dehydrogenase E1 component subunit alpha [Sphingobium fuliginis]
MQTRNDTLLWMYEHMALSRYYEERIKAAYMIGKTPLFNMANGPLPGEMHLSNGQEPCAVGVCAHLGPEDFVSAGHRPHHVAIAKGVDLPAMTAEIFGRSTGLSGGQGGHMHLFDPAVNFTCSGIIAQGMGPAVGAALAFRMRGEPHVAVAYVGEAAVNQGAWHEAMNLAAVWKLPFICIVEDNGWGVSVSKAASTAVPRNDVRVAGYGMPGVHIADNDTLAIHAAAGEAVARARAGEGPTLIEIETFRLEGHFMGDVETYRPEGEKEGLFARDEIPRFRAMLIERGIADEATISSIEQGGRARVDDAFDHALASPEPMAGEAFATVFAESEEL